MNRKVNLGFGIMRLPYNDNSLDMVVAKETIDSYMEGKFCYFDLHPNYLQGNAQKVFEKLVVQKYSRERYLVANKMPYYGIKTYEDYQFCFENQLKECGVSFFDYYMLHAITEDVYNMHEKIGGFAFLKEKKKSGEIKQIGFSFHDKPNVLEKILKEHSEIDFVQLQLNFFDWESPLIYARENYEVARKFGKKLIVMEPIKGGLMARKIVVDDKEITVKEIVKNSFLFLINLEGVEIVLSGMTSPSQVKENRETFEMDNDCVSKEFCDKVTNVLKNAYTVNCTKCGYCLRECSKKIQIPRILEMLNEYKSVESNKYMGDSVYHGNFAPKERASQCLLCGKCEKHCPQKIEIRRCLKEAVRVFESDIQEGNCFYTAERNVQVLIALLKAHGIRKVVASPGAMNVCFVYSVQQDTFFEVYSSVDERSAAYIACGLAEESGEPVVLTCTGATASRNYMPGLTEAFYRKLPILEITATQPDAKIGHNIPQIVDRRNLPNDIVKYSVEIQRVLNIEDEKMCITSINKAILALKHTTTGPVHINLVSFPNKDFSVKKLPEVRVIKRLNMKDSWPVIQQHKIAVFCGAHSVWSTELLNAVEKFCEHYNAIVISDLTSNYKGENAVRANLVLDQECKCEEFREIDLLIHIGNVSGAYLQMNPKEVWRISPDGEVVDTFFALTHVFETDEETFFYRMVQNDTGLMKRDNQISKWESMQNYIEDKMKELPFSNLWIAKETAHLLPENSVLHLGILNSLRSWNYYKVPANVFVYSNTGGFGIDGCVSSLLGASLSNKDKIHIGIVGDLAFFYDMNVLGNRYWGNNIRLIVVNNGCGTEFKNYSHMAAMFKKETDSYIAAKGHYGNKSKALLASYAESLNMDYCSVNTKEEYLDVISRIVSPKMEERSLIVEVFTDSEDESNALKVIRTVNGEKSGIVNEKHELPQRIKLAEKKKQVVLWGAGGCYRNYISRVRSICSVTKVCDNKTDRWGKEIQKDIFIISPEELSGMKDIFVVIMIEDAKTAFAIANQLLDMGIKDFDWVYNWLEYATEEQYV